MTSLKLLNQNKSPTRWACATTNCVRLFKDRKEAEEFDYDSINSNVHVVGAVGSFPPRPAVPSFGTCSYCDSDIDFFCVARFIRVGFPDKTDFEVAEEIAQGGTQSVSDRPWHQGSAGGCYKKDQDFVEEPENSGMLICDVILSWSEVDALTKAAQINNDETQFYNALVLPCHVD